ncbi:TetR/AcrR family transcriptional regulator [Microbacterium sp. A93]|uniref:TetR/AcrR family transcriptional regulator n=1 Tax=Microbacterium sp. A93 TaxID=3450716 RepID=UPI003F431194
MTDSEEAPEAKAHSARQRQIMSAITDLFLGHGFANFSMDTLASTLSCSKATLYAIAPSRNLLIHKVAVQYFRDAAAKAEQAAARQTSPEQAVLSYLTCISVELGRASPNFLNELREDPTTRGMYESNTRFAAQRVGELASSGSDRIDAYVEELVAAVMFHLHANGFRSRGIDDAEAVRRLALLLSSGMLHA